MAPFIADERIKNPKPQTMAPFIAVGADWAWRGEPGAREVRPYKGAGPLLDGE